MHFTQHGARHPRKANKARSYPALLAVLVLMAALLGACGFHLKGVSPLPFTTLYTNISDNSAFGAALRRALRASSPSLRFVEDAADAQVQLQQLQYSRRQRELSIDAKGLVEEYELTLTYIFALRDRNGAEILPPTTLTAIREVAYDPTAIQAKESEISLIFRDMEQTLVNRIVRQLSSPDVNSAYHYALDHQETETELDELLPTRALP